MERTMVLLKPDAVGRGLNFKITERFENKQFALVACRMVQPTKALAEAHYAPLKGTPAFEPAVARLLEGAAIATAWEAPGAIAAAHALVGDADPLKADLSSIRGELALDAACNLLECSADAAAAKRELAIWFTPDELGSAAAGASSSAAPGAAATPPAGGASAASAAAGSGGLSKAQQKKLEKEAKKAEKKGGGKAAAAPAVDPDFYEPPSGTRDFFPEEMRVRTWLFDKFRETARLFAFQEYDAPVLEKVELYERKAGEEITDQMYNFVDKDGKRVTLRPEMTPTLARMVLSLGDRFLKPVKWYSVPQCWRFETVQRGRKREHFQWNMDIVGEESIAAEVELLAAITKFFSSVGITSNDVGIKVNSRKVLSCILKLYGVPDELFARVAVIVDKLDKIGPADTVKLLETMTDKDGAACGLPSEAAQKIVASLGLKDIEDLRALTGEHGKEAVDELTTLFEVARAYGYGDWIFFDASVVRGLAYYTGIVFEGFDRNGELRAICGGGRYDRLYSDCYYSPKMVPAVGFGFGDCVIMELLKQKNQVPTLAPLIDFVVMAFNADMRAGQVECAAKLREAGYAVDVLLEPAKKVAKAFNYADRINGRRSLFVAPDEWANGKVRMKDLRSDAQSEKEVDLNVATLVADLQNLGIFPSDKPFGVKE